MQLIAGMLVVLALYFVPTAMMRVFDQNTKLGLFEDNIDGVSTEFMRRSPALKANFEAFRTCARQKICDFATIFAERDRVVKSEWSMVFDRVSVRGDWWSLAEEILPPNRTEQSEIDRDQFFDELKKLGSNALRNHCVPKIVYLYDRAEDRTTYDTAGFTCSPQPDRKRSG